MGRMSEMERRFWNPVWTRPLPGVRVRRATRREMAMRGRPPDEEEAAALRDALEAEVEKRRVEAKMERARDRRSGRERA